MTAVYEQIRRFVADEGGATAIEYGLIAALVAVGMLIALTTLGGGVSSMFDYVSSRSAEQLDNIDEI
jgi:pilus assembly protein Flp/PilA